MLKVGIIGTGNLATHLVPALQKLDFLQVQKVYGRNTLKAQTFAQKYNLIPIEEINEFDDINVLFCLTNDDSIKKISHEFVKEGLLDLVFIHCSGIKGLEEISSKLQARGIFYPVQSFSKNDRLIDFENIPICIVEEENNNKWLKKIAGALSNRVYKISQEQKEHLHLAAVFANNFPNHLIHISRRILLERNMEPELLLPLISKTFEKLENMEPKDAQTGPALREDLETLHIHHELLENHKLLQNIYEILSFSIIKSKSE